MFQKSRGAITAAATETFPAILTDAGKVSKVALGGGIWDLRHPVQREDSCGAVGGLARASSPLASRFCGKLFL